MSRSFRNLGVLVSTAALCVGVSAFEGRAEVTEPTTPQSPGQHRAVTDRTGGYSISVAANGWSFPRPRVGVGHGPGPDVPLRGELVAEHVLTATAAFDRQSYRNGDTALLVLTVTNGGRAAVPGVTGSFDEDGGTAVDLGDLRYPGPGVTLPPGGTRTVQVRLPVDDHRADLGRIRVSGAFGSPPFGEGSAGASALARVPGRRAARVEGLLAVRRASASDVAGALTSRPLPGAEVHLRDQVTGAVLVRDTTDEQGRFGFSDVPVGLHDTGVVGPWEIVSGKDFPVSAGGDPGVRLVLVEPGPEQPDPDSTTLATTSPEVGTAAPTTPSDAGSGLAGTGTGASWRALAGLLALLTGALLVAAARRGRT
ncbi:hypothetical protein JOF41_001885 [Saccharothrix coeruleofusca]|uniref:hypothetical protein n=1 Tax=Saccharothrix coeruleofusca TaxID=33919 RepID=UPI001AEB19EB|nr:hypothetical protein [Saccharothrix coeruleofusca]MBP2335707.1 hypothetical protein [Saccharothrix coeruleofusca]